MKNHSKKIISIMLMAGLILATAALALPNATGIAADPPISATATTSHNQDLLELFFIFL